MQYTRLLPRHVYVFWYLSRQKKTADAIKFLGILKKYFSKNKILFCFKNNSNFLDITINDLRYEIKFQNHTISKPDFITQIIYRNIHKCLYSLFILFLFFLFCSFYVSPSLFIQLEKVQQQNEWKKKARVLEHGHEYVTGQVNSSILELLLRRFCCLILHHLTVSFFPNDHKRYSSHVQVSILYRVAPIKVYLTIYKSLENSYLKKVFVP